ncbi:hypothetical protein DJ70_11670 [Halorubrum halodurans]|uniref:Uncharacterized protein n=1 Tax=Halorubrum halodurans TaxID=1383851 RepID=A0A256IFU1_9EURY|nr:hypothetical protein DJ70_11670 [Halorubrum halodurans]
MCLEIVSPTGAELELADDIVDHALSSTDARCLAIASQRDARSCPMTPTSAHVANNSAWKSGISFCCYRRRSTVT